MSGCQGLAGSVDYAIKKIRKTENSLRCKRKNERERMRFSFFTRARALEGKSQKENAFRKLSRMFIQIECLSVAFYTIRVGGERTSLRTRESKSVMNPSANQSDRKAAQPAAPTASRPRNAPNCSDSGRQSHHYVLCNRL
jgi:hypothetical protein